MVIGSVPFEETGELSRAIGKHSVQVKNRVNGWGVLKNLAGDGEGQVTKSDFQTIGMGMARG